MNKNKLLASAQKYMRKGQYRKAIGEYEKVLKEDPDDVRARLSLANLYYRQKDTERAVETFLDVARIYEDGGFTLKSIAVYKQVLKIVPDREDLYVALANNYQHHGLLNEAAAQYREALKILERKGDQLGKLNVIRQILELDPDNIPDRLRLAEAYSAMGQITDAVRGFRQVAESLEQLGYTDDFQRSAERLLYHQPDDAAMAKKLAASYVASGQPQRALPKLRIAFRSGPRDLEVLGTLADGFNQLGQIHKAVMVLKEMARLYEKSGLEKERDECFQEILVLNPDDEDARAVLGTAQTDDAGATIEFDDDEGEVPPRPEEKKRALPTRQRGEAPRIGAGTGVMSPAQAARAMRTSQTAQGDARLRPAPAAPAVQATASAAAAEDLIEQMIREAMEEPTVRAPGDVASGLGGASTGADDFDFDDMEEDDEFGFGDSIDQTIADSSFIPEDVLAEVQSGLGLTVPSGDAAPRETFAEGEELLREELQELDFYIANGLLDEARVLIGELKDRYRDHPYVLRRQDKVARMR